MKYVVYDITTGEITRVIDCPPDAVNLQIRPTEGVIEGDIKWGLQYVSNGSLTDYTAVQAARKAVKPSYQCEWSNREFSWIDVRELQEVKQDRWNDIKNARQSAITAPLTTPHGVFDADETSQKNITNAIALMQTLESANTPQTVNFILFDNTMVELNTTQMIEIGVMLGQRTQSAYATSWILRNRIDNATTVLEVQNISWPG